MDYLQRLRNIAKKSNREISRFAMMSIEDTINFSVAGISFEEGFWVYTIWGGESEYPIYVGCTKIGPQRIQAHFTGQGQRDLHRLLKATEPFCLRFSVIFMFVGGDKSKALQAESFFERKLEPWIATRAWHGGVKREREGYSPWYIQEFWKDVDRYVERYRLEIEQRMTD